MIEKNSNKFNIYSIGIGKYFDEDLIKNAGVLGKGNYNFCPDFKNLNELIATEIKNSSYKIYSELEINSPFDEKCLYKLNNKSLLLIKNQFNNFKYIIEKKEGEEIDSKNIKLELKYINNGKENNIEKYEINAEELPLGEDLSKLIINDYLINNSKNLTEQEKIKLSLKYQILTDNTSLFAEIESTDKISYQMSNKEEKEEKEKIYKDSVKQLSDEQKKKMEEEDKRMEELIREVKEGIALEKQLKTDLGNSKAEIKEIAIELEVDNKKKAKSNGFFGFFKNVGSSIKGLFSNQKNSDENITSLPKNEKQLKE